MPEMFRKHENNHRDNEALSHNEDLRASRFMANKGKAATQSNPASKGPRRHIDYSVSQVSESIRRLSGGSDKSLYAEDHVFSVIDPDYPELCQPVEGHTA